MGRAVVTKGHSGRRLGRKIRRLEDSVEFSAKESEVRKAEVNDRKSLETSECENSPVENLREAFNLRRHKSQSDIGKTS